VAALQPKAFILSGGPNSVYDDGAPTLPAYVIDARVPILGICYGQHLLTQALAAKYCRPLSASMVTPISKSSITSPHCLQIFN